jgi:hypothetical protein
MTINFRAILMVAVVAVAGIAFATSALAQGNNGDNTRPGWGYGDKNHVHTGPPGQSVHPGDNNDQGNGKNKNK